MKDKVHAAMSIGSGKRTYIIAACLILQAIIPFLMGEINLGEVDARSVLEGLGLATLRAGVGR